MAIITVIYGLDGQPVSLSDLRIRAQRDRNPDMRLLMREWIKTLEAGGLPDGWSRREVDDDTGNCRAGTGVYGYEH